jgi:hypothetical protein
LELNHGRVGTPPKRIDFQERKETIFGRFTVLDTEMF